jgi:hypothetical protein
MSKVPSDMTEVELVTSYNATRDLSGLDDETIEPVQVRRNVTISVRLSQDKIGLLGELRVVVVAQVVRDAVRPILVVQHPSAHVHVLHHRCNAHVHAGQQQLDPASQPRQEWSQ